MLIQERSRSLEGGIFSSSVVGLREPISTTRHSARAGMRLAKSRSCAGVAAFGLNLESTGMLDRTAGVISQNVLVLRLGLL